MAPFLLGVDVGTSVIKSILFDADGHELAGASRETQLLHPAPAWVEQDMPAVWQAVVETAHETVVKSGCPADAVAAVGITGQGDGTWLVDDALDIFPLEPPPADWPLLRLPNVTLTPHVAGSSRESAERGADMVARDIAGFLAGRPPANCVNPAVLR